MEPVSKLTLMTWITATVAALLALLAPIHTLMGAVGVLIFADFITGMAAAKKKGEPITSKAMSRTVWKTLAYQLAIISGFAMEYLIGGNEVLPVAKVCASIIGIVEFQSLAENVKVLTGVDLRAVVERVSELGRKPPKE